MAVRLQEALYGLPFKTEKVVYRLPTRPRDQCSGRMRRRTVSIRFLMEVRADY
jgi:hypothetical protein